MDLEELNKQKEAAHEKGDKAEEERLAAFIDEVEENALDGQVLVDGDQYDDVYEAYKSLMGEVESRNVQKRLSMSPEERAATPPWETEDVDEDRQIVRREGSGESHMAKVGVRPDGIEVYESDPAVKKLPYKERIKKFRDMMLKQYAGRTARFTKNGTTYYATFDRGGVQKNIYGDNQSDSKGHVAKVNAGASGDIFDIVENSNYNHTAKESGKANPMHKGVLSWDYFDKSVQIDGEMFNVLINVRDKGNNQFVYNVAVRKQ